MIPYHGALAILLSAGVTALVAAGHPKVALQGRLR